jgi:2-dehydropantoate 2-reductase
VKRKAIAESGLTIITDENEITVFPNIVSDDPLQLESLIILFAQQNKTYDIEESLRSLEKCITKNTFILPYNGVDAQERISTLYPDNEV